MKCLFCWSLNFLLSITECPRWSYSVHARICKVWRLITNQWRTNLEFDFFIFPHSPSRDSAMFTNLTTYCTQLGLCFPLESINQSGITLTKILTSILLNTFVSFFRLLPALCIAIGPGSGRHYVFLCVTIFLSVSPRPTLSLFARSSPLVPIRYGASFCNEHGSIM